MIRQEIAKPNYLSKTYIIHSKVSIAERVKSRKLCGPYICTRTEPESEIFFYMDKYEQCGDSSFDLRLTWCDELEPSSHRIDHTGWFTDEYQDGDKIRGIVARLPHGRGFLAGWSMGASMASVIDTSVIIEDATSAAYAADSMAEQAAEREREYQHIQDQITKHEERIEELSEELTDKRTAWHDARVSMRCIARAVCTRKALHIACSAVDTLENAIHEVIEAIRTEKEELTELESIV